MRKRLSAGAAALAWALVTGAAHQAVLIANWRFDLLEPAHWAYVGRGFSLWWYQGVALRSGFLALLASALLVPLGGAVIAARWAHRRAGNTAPAPKPPIARNPARAASVLVRVLGRLLGGALCLVLRPLTGLPRVQVTITLDPPGAPGRPPVPTRTVVARPAPVAEGTLQTRARLDIGMTPAKPTSCAEGAAVVELTPSEPSAPAAEWLPAAPPRPSRYRGAGTAVPAPAPVAPAATATDDADVEAAAITAAGTEDDAANFADDGVLAAAEFQPSPMPPSGAVDHEEIIQEMDPDMTSSDIAAAFARWLRTNNWAVRDDVHVDADRGGAFTPDSLGDEPRALIPLLAMAPHQIWLIFPVSLEGRSDWLAAEWQIEHEEPPLWEAYSDGPQIPCPVRAAVHAASRFWDHHGAAIKKLQHLQASAVRALVVLANGQLANHDEVAPSWAAVEELVTVIHFREDDGILEEVFGKKIEGNANTILVKMILDASNDLARSARKDAA